LADLGTDDSDSRVAAATFGLFRNSNLSLIGCIGLSIWWVRRLDMIALAEPSKFVKNLLEKQSVCHRACEEDNLACGHGNAFIEGYVSQW